MNSYYIYDVDDTSEPVTTSWKLYDPGTQAAHNTSWTGIWPSDQTGNITYYLKDNFVMISIPETLATADTSALITNVTALPSNIRPLAESTKVILVADSTGDKFGVATVGTNGIITIGVQATQSVFAGSGSSGMKAFSLSYRV